MSNWEINKAIRKLEKTAVGRDSRKKSMKTSEYNSIEDEQMMLMKSCPEMSFMCLLRSLI